MLKIANSYGNYEISQGVPKGYRFIWGERLTLICKRLGIKHVKAVVGFTGEKKYGYRPQFGGVVVTARQAPKLLAAIQAKQNNLSFRPAPKRLDLNIKNVSHSLYIVNKHAKQVGQAAACAYEDGRWTSATARSRDKERLYSLKSRVLTHALTFGWASVEKYHSVKSVKSVRVYDDYDDQYGDYYHEEPEERIRYFRLIRFGGHTFHEPLTQLPEGVQVVDLGHWESDAEIVGKHISLPRAVELLQRFLDQSSQVMIDEIRFDLTVP